MAGLKKQETKEGVSRSAKPLKISHVLFSFKHVTRTNRHYSFSYFDKEFRKAHKAYDSLFQKMREVSQMDMLDFLQFCKKSGLETINYRFFAKSVQSVFDTTGILAKESDLVVIRFSPGGKDDYRLICKMDSDHQNIFHVIAFDFDHSAYDHG